MILYRFIVMDEADRMMDEGHFPELHTILDYTQATVPISSASSASSSSSSSISVTADSIDAPLVSMTQRQTLLFSATCIANQHMSPRSVLKQPRNNSNSKHGASDATGGGGYKNQKLVVLDQSGTSGKLQVLSNNLQKLLLLTSLKGVIRVVDTTSNKLANDPSTTSNSNSTNTESASFLAQSLPKGLVQYECHVPRDEKDALLVHLLLQVSTSI